MAVTGFWITLKENSWSLENNTSSVTASVYISTTNSYNLLNTANGALSFGGNASGSYSFKHTFGTYATTCVYSRTFTVTHNADGSGSVSASAWFDTRVSAGTVRASASLTLTKIPRASTPTVSGTKELGKTLTLNMNRASSGYTHTVRYSFAGNTGTIGTGIGASTTWTPQLAWANDMPNAASGTCTLTTTTYSGSTVIGTTTATFTLSVPSSMNPTIDSVTLTDQNGYMDAYGGLIGEKSVAKVATTATAKYGATIKSYAVSIGSDTGTGANATVNITAPTSASETRTLKVVATDSRGRTATKTQSVTVLAYQYPNITEVSAKRWDTTGNKENDESTTVRVRVAGTLMQGLDGQGNTTAEAVVQYRLKGATQYTDAGTLDLGQTFDTHIDIEGMDSAKVYEVTVQITDSFGTVSGSGTLLVPTATPIMDFKADGSGMAFFGVSRFAGLHFNSDVTLTSADGTGAKILGFSGGETPYPLISTWPDMASADQKPSMRIGGDYYSDEFTEDRVFGLNLLWEDYLGGDIGAAIWTGAWSSGSVTIQNIQKYRLFLIYTGTASAVDVYPIIAGKSFGYSDDFSICGIGGYPAGTSDNTQTISAVQISVTGTSCRLVRSCYLTHSATGNYTHSQGQTRPIWQIVGLL